MEVLRIPRGSHSEENVRSFLWPSEQQARYVSERYVGREKPGWAKMVMMKQIHSDNARPACRLSDRKSGAIAVQPIRQ